MAFVKLKPQMIWLGSTSLYDVISNLEIALMDHVKVWRIRYGFDNQTLK